MLTEQQIQERIRKALHRGGGTHSFEDVMAGLQDGRYQIFWNDHGVCITEICQTPQARYLNCFVVAGELPGVMDLHEKVKQFGRDNHCKWMQTTARLGWDDVLPKWGWKKQAIVFAHEIEEEAHG